MIDLLAAVSLMLPAEETPVAPTPTESATATPEPTATPLTTPTVTPTPTPTPTRTTVPAPPMSKVYSGEAKLRIGMQGASIEKLQTQLTGVGKPARVTGVFDKQTQLAYKSFQSKYGYWPTGVVTKKPALYLKQLYGNGKLPKACLTGRIICVDKTQLVLRSMKNGKVKLVTDVRFGSSETPTRDGRFKVYYKVKYLISDLSGTPMPWSLFFSGGQAVHYSPGFARDGYNGSSLGCVNVGKRKAAKWIFQNNPVGTPVLIYRSGR